MTDEIITDMRRLIREIEEVKERLRVIERKIDDIKNEMTQKNFSQHIS